ncbi:hypothetical protein ES706_03721 [subsurface metagenome]
MGRKTSFRPKAGSVLISLALVISLMAVLTVQVANVNVVEATPREVAENWIDYVNPFIGVGISHNYPAVCVPFGFTQWTPCGAGETGSEYVPYYGATSITGFRGSHFPHGSCMKEYASITIQPQAGVLKTSINDRNTPMKLPDIEAHPDYWACTLQDDFDLRVEVTATLHCGFFKVTPQDSGDAHILVDAHYGGTTEVHAEDNEIWVLNVQHGSAGSYILGYSVVKFDSSFLTSSGADGQFAHADYHVGGGEVILAKVGTSYISYDQARANLDAEIPDWEFDQVRGETRDEWNQELGKIEVEGGTEDQKVIFYSALYHTFLEPRVSSEQGRYYSAFDGHIHTCEEGREYYNNFSLWDTFRAEHPLLTIVQPKRTEDMCQALVNMYKEGGWFPKWPNPGYTGVMISTHSDSVIADAYLKGLDNFDIENAYVGSMKHATTPGPLFYEARFHITEYMELGFVPVTVDSTSRTLEFAYGDWCIAQLAKALGKENDYDYLMSRALNYRNVYDPEAKGDGFTGFVRGRYDDGSWTFPFDPNIWYGYICEGTPWHYTWFAPQDVQGLINLMGGRSNFNAKLDYFFQKSAIGGFYYTLGNEPTHHTIELFDYSGMPWRTQYWARWYMQNKYSNIGDSLSGGLCGNDDCGAISAWYVFNAMGFFPVCPGDGTYQIGSPIFDRVTIHLPEYHYGGVDFVIEAHNNSAENMYIQSATLNGIPLIKPWITHSDIADGGILTFEMGPEPNEEWGSHPSLAPPSMTPVPRSKLEIGFEVPESVELGEPFAVNVSIKNVGANGQDVVTLFVDNDPVDSRILSLDAGETTGITLTGVLETPGDHEVRVEDLPPKILSTGPPHKPWFVNDDDEVNLFDLMLVAGHWGESESSPGWLPAADVDGDGEVGLFDLMLVAGHWGETR